jgi:signal transduction histidine kinase
MKEIKSKKNRGFQSQFMKSIVWRILAIFVIVSIIIIYAALRSFTSEIQKNVLEEHKNKLSFAEQTISMRLEEIASIGYNIGKDPAFYLEPIEDDPNVGDEMSEMLKRYLVGNNFIKHLAFYRISEPDTLYISTGERSIYEFFSTDLGLNRTQTDAIISGIQSQNKISMNYFNMGKNAYFAYSYPLPQLSEKPKAYVLMLIPSNEISPLFNPLVADANANVLVYDGDGREVFHMGTVEDEFSVDNFLKSSDTTQEYKASSGKKYVLQKITSTSSSSNGWKYISIIDRKDTFSGIANKQIAAIFFLLIVLVISFVVMLISIFLQYKPIQDLAKELLAEKDKGNSQGDERKLLSKAIANLKENSEQKTKYENAFYEAEAASKAKSAFLSSMSHDIRTPMNAIIGMTDLAMSHLDNRQYVEDCLKKVQISSNYLLDIINNVLDMSRIESGRIPIAKDEINIHSLVDNIVSLLTSSLEMKSQKLIVDVKDIDHPLVLGDNIHITQVFVNIVSNAIKFTPEGGTITISVHEEKGQKNKHKYVFTFTDTGIGIPKDFIPRVFDTFSRANNYSTITEGTGLGMAIAKKLIELMDGTIECTSEQGIGTTFTVELPLDAVQSVPVNSMNPGYCNSLGNKPATFDAIDLTGKRILLVEDNEINREIAYQILLCTGAFIEQVTNGGEAVETFLNHPLYYYDLILMDIQMPIKNGYEATKEIRESSREDGKSVPIYAVTANTFDEDVRQVHDAGMNGHIGKPYNQAIIYMTLAKVFSKNKNN